MPSLASLKRCETEKWKEREFNGKMAYPSVHLYNDRFLPYIEVQEENSLSVLDLLYMKTKKFAIQWNSEPITSSNDPNFKQRGLDSWNIILTDLHTIIAQINQKINNGEMYTGFIVLHLDYENSTAIFKRPLIQLNGNSLVDRPRCFTFSNDGFDCIFDNKLQNYLKKLSVYKMSYSSDCVVEQTTTQQVDFSKQIYITGLVNNNLYGFWCEDWNKSKLSKMVRFCLETKQQTTLKLSGWPTKPKYTEPCHNDAVWLGRTLVLNVTTYDDTIYFYVVSLDLLHWRKLNVQLELRIDRLFSNYENTLVLQTRGYRNERKRYYRLNFNRPDTLVNLSLYAIKEDSQILRNAVDYLPNQFKCPFVKNSRENDLQPCSKRPRIER